MVFLSVRGKGVCLFLLLFMFLPSSLQAVDLGDNIRLHGFLSQGYMDSQGNNFLGETEGGTFAITEVGINVNGQLTDKFRLGGQLLYRDFGSISNGKIHLDWLISDYHVTDLLGTRLGKIKLPMGLYNMERDSDFLRSLIFLPQSIYDETRRDSWQAHWGGEIYGNLYLGDWGDMDYQFFGGLIDYDDDSVATRVATNRVNHFNMGSEQFLSVDNLSRENNYVFGGALFYDSAVEGLRGALTFLSLEDETWVDSTQVSSFQLHAKIVASLEYTWRQFSMTAEYSEADRTQKHFGVTILHGWSPAWYLLLSYSPIEDLTLSLLYDEYYRLKDNNEPVGDRNLYPWRKDLAAAIRYDITENWTAKGEWHVLDGTAFYMSYFNPGGAERYWQYGALKLTFNF